MAALRARRISLATIDDRLLSLVEPMQLFACC